MEEECHKPFCVFKKPVVAAGKCKTHYTLLESWKNGSLQWVGDSRKPHGDHHLCFLGIVLDLGASTGERKAEGFRAWGVVRRGCLLVRIPAEEEGGLFRGTVRPQCGALFV